MAEIFETAIVEKRNVLNELRATNLTLQELRFFSIYLSKINPYDKKTKDVRFPLSDFQKIMEFGRLNIQQLKESTDSLLGKKVHIPLESGGFKGIVLFDQCEVNKDIHGRWYVEISASNAALPLMFDFKDRYFKYELWNALRLKSANQIRMYEILKQYEKLGKREIAINDLRELLGIAPNEYPRWNNFKTRVLDSCQQALKEITDISFEYERGKVGNGGKWLTIIFTISKNEPTDSQMVLFEQDLENHINLKALQSDEGIMPNKDDSNNNNDISSDIEFYMVACNNEFTVAQTESILSIINSMELPEHEMGIVFAKYHYLEEQYSRFNAYSEQHTIINRYSYFYTMLISERDKQRAGEGA
ncbi:MAG: replication initiation protein [Alphaproteobacteria bacterium]|nr:replication initiation protein [Alphaproteobacteria bacterium]